MNDYTYIHRVVKLRTIISLEYIHKPPYHPILQKNWLDNQKSDIMQNSLLQTWLDEKTTTVTENFLVVGQAVDIWICMYLSSFNFSVNLIFCWLFSFPLVWFCFFFLSLIYFLKKDNNFCIKKSQLSFCELFSYACIYYNCY